MLVERRQPIDDDLRLLRRSRVVEPHEAPAVHPLLQNRKISANHLGIEDPSCGPQIRNDLGREFVPGRGGRRIDSWRRALRHGTSAARGRGLRHVTSAAQRYARKLEKVRLLAIRRSGARKREHRRRPEMLGEEGRDRAQVALLRWRCRRERRAMQRPGDRRKHDRRRRPSGRRREVGVREALDRRGKTGGVVRVVRGHG